MGDAQLWNEPSVVMTTADKPPRILAIGTTPELWQNLQTQYELDVAKRSIWAKIKKTVVPYGKVAVF